MFGVVAVRVDEAAASAEPAPEVGESGRGGSSSGGAPAGLSSSSSAVPPGHTAYSWAAAAGDATPPGHTAYSWGPADYGVAGAPAPGGTERDGGAIMEFYSGNPCVQIVRGRVSLFTRVSGRVGAVAGAAGSASSSLAYDEPEAFMGELSCGR
jgi:hypothetical protein